MKGILVQSTSNWPSRGFHTFFPQVLMYPKISWCHQVSVRYVGEGRVCLALPSLNFHCRPLDLTVGWNLFLNGFIPLWRWWSVMKCEIHFSLSNGCVTDEGRLWSSLPLHGTCLCSSVTCRSSLMYHLWLLLPIPTVSWRTRFSEEESAFLIDGAGSKEHRKGGK